MGARLDFNPRPLREGTTRGGFAGREQRGYFNPRPLREGTTIEPSSRAVQQPDFNPRPLREGTTKYVLSGWWECSISIHVPYERGRLRPPIGDECAGDFNPRPLREGTTRHMRAGCSMGDFNPRPLREGTTGVRGGYEVRGAISIHVPYERGRPVSPRNTRYIVDFNPRPLREGTTSIRDLHEWLRDISIHVPYERGRLLGSSCGITTRGFQSTSPTRGDDLLWCYNRFIDREFQSTSPTRGDDRKILYA